MAFNKVARTQSSSHFAEAVHASVKRSTFPRNWSRKTTFNAGELVPLAIQEVLPSDTFELDIAHVVRLATPLVPTMDEIYMDLYAFFVPNRIVFDGWEELNGENKAGFWTPTVEPDPVPFAVLNTTNLQPGPWSNTNINQGSIGDHYGIPRGASLANTQINCMPFRGYGLIWNEWFRDQNHQAPVVVTTGSTEPETSAYAPNQGLFKVNKPHDYFTSALPATQKGDLQGLKLGEIELPAGWIPVYNRGVATPEGGLRVPNISDGGETMLWTQNYVNNQNAIDMNTTAVAGISRTPAAEITIISTGTGDTFGQSIQPASLWARTGVQDDGAISLPSAFVNDIRLAFQLQKLLERDARSGTRYIEMLKAHFNAEAEDYRLQRPEFLGHERFQIEMSQVADTAGTNEHLATLGAFSYSPGKKHGLIKKTFVEHGFVHVFAVARHRKTYQQGIEKFWFRRERFDYFYPVLAHISEQPIYNKEIYFTDDGEVDNEVFGYQEAWADLRFKQNETCGGFRSQAGTVGLDIWHYGDVYDQLPVLSAGWVEDNSDINISRTLAVGRDIQDQFLADFAFKLKATRPMPTYSIPGMIDHF